MVPSLSAFLILLIACFREFYGSIASKSDHVLSRQKRIVGGREADIREFPFLVQIHERYANFYKFVCAGTIIHERFILSAAHCFINFDTNRRIESWKNYNFLEIVAGTKFMNGADGDRYNVERYYIPSNFDLTGANDICLLKVEGVIVMDNGRPVKKARLPWRGVSNNLRATVAGWGGLQSFPLKKLDVQTLHPLVCQAVWFKNIFNRRCDFVFAHKEYNNGYGIEYGDSGGGLYQHNFVIGVVSTLYGIPGTHPDEYTDVFKHVHWIKGITLEHHI